MSEDTRRKAIEALQNVFAPAYALRPDIAGRLTDVISDLMREIAREESEADRKMLLKVVKDMYIRQPTPEAIEHGKRLVERLNAEAEKSAAPTPATGEWDMGKGHLNTQAAPDNSSLRAALDDAYLSASARDRPTCAKGPHQTHHVTKGQYNAQHEQRSTGDGDVLRGSEQPGRTITAMVGAVASVARTVAGESGGTEASIRFVRGVPPISRDSHGVTDVVDRGSNLDSAAVDHGAKRPPETTQEWPGPPGYYPEYVWLSGQTAYSDAHSSGTARPKYIRADVAAKEVSEAVRAELIAGKQAHTKLYATVLDLLGGPPGETVEVRCKRVVAERDAARQEVSAVDMLRESAISDRERERERADRAEVSLAKAGTCISKQAKALDRAEARVKELEGMREGNIAEMAQHLADVNASRAAIIQQRDKLEQELTAANLAIESARKTLLAVKP